MGVGSDADGIRQERKNISYLNLIAQESDLERYEDLKVQADET